MFSFNDYSEIKKGKTITGFFKDQSLSFHQIENIANPSPDSVPYGGDIFSAKHFVREGGMAKTDNPYPDRQYCVEFVNSPLNDAAQAIAVAKNPETWEKIKNFPLPERINHFYPKEYIDLHLK